MLTKDDYVSPETAKMLKDKGFNEVCEFCIFKDGIGICKRTNWWPIGFITYPYPTLYEAQKWLRERHGIAVNVYNRISTYGVSWSYEFNKIQTCKYVTDRNSTSATYKTYEQALDAGIREALELIKED